VRLSEAARAHLVGINGAGLSSLAAYLCEGGTQVTGSDQRSTALTGSLQQLGVRVSLGHDPSLVDFEGGFVVRSAAIPQDNPELVQARRLGLPVYKYSQVLGAITKERSTFAVAGTHGKTSTCGLALAAFRGAGLDPGYILGGSVNGDGLLGGARGSQEHLLVEACEYDRSFLKLSPRVAVVLNVDADHFDCYRDEAETYAAYRNFLARVLPGGLAILPEQDRRLTAMAGELELRHLTFGDRETADLQARITGQRAGCYRFDCTCRGGNTVRVQLKVPGRHMVGNALAALGMVVEAGGDLGRAAAGLARYQGMRRRFEVSRGRRGGVLVSDYAHHPTELMAVLESARQAFPKRRNLALFQPHQHSRTRALLADFAAVLARFDLVLLADIYAARDSEEDLRSVSSSDLAREIACQGGEVELVGPARSAGDRVAARVKPGSDALFLLGAGDVDQLIPHLLTRL
jgi:UDP-N-acetylmuramate--alanine ligase